MLRLNHMAMSLPRGTLTEQWITDVKALYGAVFGWDVAAVRLGTGTRAPIHHVYMQLDPHGYQYLVLAESDVPMTVDGSEHLGVSCDSADEVRGRYEQCERFREEDDRLTIAPPGLVVVDPAESGFTMTFDNGWSPPYVTTGFNFGYLMPVRWDVQYDEYTSSPDRRWTYGPPLTQPR